MRQKALAPSWLRKVPEIFCCTLAIRRSLSARLLSNGTLKSYIKAKTSCLCSSRRSSRFRALLFFGLPLFFLVDFFFGRGFSLYPLSRMFWYRVSNVWICSLKSVWVLVL